MKINLLLVALIFLSFLVFSYLCDIKYIFEIFNNFYTPIVTGVSAYFVYKALKTSSQQHLDIVTLSRINSIESNLAYIDEKYKSISTPKYSQVSNNNTDKGKEAIEKLIDSIDNNKTDHEIHELFRNVIENFSHSVSEINYFVKNSKNSEVNYFINSLNSKYKKYYEINFKDLLRRICEIKTTTNDSIATSEAKAFYNENYKSIQSMLEIKESKSQKTVAHKQEDI